LSSIQDTETVFRKVIVCTSTIAALKGEGLLEVVIKVSGDKERPVAAALRSFVGPLLWRHERKDSGICLLKAAVTMDAGVDRVLGGIEEALQSVESKHLLAEALSVELQVLEAGEVAGTWRKPLRPGRVTPRLSVYPPCEGVNAGEDQRLLFIDAQEAFGDGNHPTTRLVLCLLDELLEGKYGPPNIGKGWVLDAGCGSGVLGLASAALGGCRVLAVDLDPRAIDAARENLRLNPGAGAKVCLTLGEVSCARGPFCIAMANLYPSAQMRVTKSLWRAVAAGGWLILSGFCNTHKNSVLHPYLQNGAVEMAYLLDQTWAGVLIRKPEAE
jgi:ribosomal protein L11 methyltransferase